MNQETELQIDNLVSEWSSQLPTIPFVNLFVDHSRGCIWTSTSTLLQKFVFWISGELREQLTITAEAAFISIERHVLTISKDGFCRVWDPYDGKKIHTFLSPAPIGCCTLPNTVAIAGVDQKLTVLDTLTGNTQAEASHSRPISHLSRFRSRGHMVSVSERTLTIWHFQMDSNSLLVHDVIEVPEDITAIATGASEFIAVGTISGKVLCIDAETKEIVRSFEGPAKSVLSVDFFGTGLIYSSEDGLYYGDVLTGRQGIVVSAAKYGPPALCGALTDRHAVYLPDVTPGMQNGMRIGVFQIRAEQSSNDNG